MSTEPKRGTCGWKGKIDVNYDTSVHQKPHLKYHSCIDWREGESAPAQPRVQQYQNRIPCGSCGHVHLGRCPHCDDCPQIVPPAAETAMRISFTRAGLRIVGEQLDCIPLKNAEGWNRYNTDCQRVLHIWADGKSYDIMVPKEEFLGDE